MRGLRVPLDPTPDRRGQVILLRDGSRAVMVDPFRSYRPEVDDRRFWDHRSTCGGTFYSMRSLQGALSEPGHDTRGFEERKARVRELRLRLDRSKA